MNKLLISVVLLSAIGFINCLPNNCDPKCAKGLKCCDTICFDESSQQCCEGVLQPNVGKIPQCCGAVVIDFSIQTCCDKVICDKIPGGLTWCCATTAYSPSVDQCCHNVTIPKDQPCDSANKIFKSGSKLFNGECDPKCGDGLKCCNSVCYDHSQQLCCNGTVLDKVGEKPQCCGGQVVDNSVTVCCNGVPHDRDGITYCCGTASFSPITDQCCNQTVVPKGTCIPTAK